jgi:uncharacterized phiE125 gp8 family phage protein
MGMKLITAPTDTPVTLAEAKAQCRVEDDSEDTLMTGLISAATEYVEQYTARAIMPQTWELSLDGFEDSMALTKGPVTSVTSVKYYDLNGDIQTLDPLNYTLDLISDPQWVVKNNDASWPATVDSINVVTIRFVAGYATVPAPIKHAILLLISQWFDNRAAVTDKAMIAVPNAVEALLTNYRSFA